MSSLRAWTEFELFFILTFGTIKAAGRLTSAGPEVCYTCHFPLRCFKHEVFAYVGRIKNIVNNCGLKQHKQAIAPPLFRANPTFSGASRGASASVCFAETADLHPFSKIRGA